MGLTVLEHTCTFLLLVNDFCFRCLIENDWDFQKAKLAFEVLQVS